MDLIKFKLVTPERVLLEEEVESLSCPTSLGQITILPHHIPLVATLVPGEISGRKEGEEYFIAVSGGFVEVRQNNEIVVLADAAEHHYEIDVERAEQARQRAQKSMAESVASDEEYAKVAASLERSLARLNIARKRAHRKGPITGEGIFTE